MGQWISRTFGSITLKVWQTDTTGNQTVYNVASWPMNTRVTNANKEQFKSTVNAYLSYIADKDLTHQLYNNYNSGVSTTLSNGNSIEFQSNGLNVVYVTYEFDSNFNDVQYSLSGYLPYRRTDLNVGIKFRCIFAGTNPNSMSYGHMLLKENSTTISDFDIISSSIAIDDITFHDTSARVDAWDINIPGYSGETYGGSDVMSHINPPMIMCEYLSGSTDRLMTSMEEPASSSNYLMPIDGFYCYSTLGIDVTAEEPQEDGYVNELMNRFSPRYYSNMTGIYVIPESTMNDLAEGLIQQNLADWLNRAFFGSDGKQYIMAFRWYYGLLDSIEKTSDLHNINFGVGKVTLGALGETPVQAKVATREFAVWQTSEMSVMPHFDNYLDMLSTYELYLPYYGFLNIDPNDIVGGTIQVIYNVNLVTGTANINVICKTARTGNNKTKCYTLNAQIGIEIPFGADMMKEMTTAWAQTCGKAFMTGASIGLGMSGQGFGNIVGQVKGAIDASKPDVTDNERAMELNNANDVQDSARNAQNVVSVAQHAMKTISDTTPALSPVVRSGGTSNESGSLDELFPYLLITRPMAVGPSNYEEYVGMPSYASANLGSIKGFTKVAAVRPVSMTDAPKYLDEILSLLQAGVYL